MYVYMSICSQYVVAYTSNIPQMVLIMMTCQYVSILPGLLVGLISRGLWACDTGFL